MELIFEPYLITPIDISTSAELHKRSNMGIPDYCSVEDSRIFQQISWTS